MNIGRRELLVAGLVAAILIVGLLVFPPWTAKGLTYEDGAYAYPVGHHFVVLGPGRHVLRPHGVCFVGAAVDYGRLVLEALAVILLCGITCAVICWLRGYLAARSVRPGR